MEALVPVIHIIGGSQNELLCELAADTAQLPVIAGPIEATALHNVLVQVRAHGAARGDPGAGRAATAASNLRPLHRREERRHGTYRVLRKRNASAALN